MDDNLYLDELMKNKNFRLIFLSGFITILLFMLGAYDIFEYLGIDFRIGTYFAKLFGII